MPPALEKAFLPDEAVHVIQDLNMADKATESNSRDSSLYQEFLAERDEVLRQKWLKSEQAGKDVGLESILVEWASETRPDWKKDYLKKLKSQPS